MKVEIYKQKGEWRWRIRARNGRILAVSSEGYKGRHHCARMAFKCCTMGVYGKMVVINERGVR